MAHVWITTADGDLLRADQIRQIDAVEGLRVVTLSGSSFLIAPVEDGPAAEAAARELAATMAEAEAWAHAAEIAVVRDSEGEGEGWSVRLRAMRDSPPPSGEATG